MSNVKDFSQLIALVEKDAKDKQNTAAYNGSHDGEARELLKQIEIFKSALAGEVPDAWKNYAKQLDPDWDEY